MHRAVALSTLVLVSLVAGPVAAGATHSHFHSHSPSADRNLGVSSPNTDQASDTETIRKSIRLHLTPSAPGVIDATLSYDVPDAVTSLSVSLPADATDVRTDDFTRRDGRWTWNGNDDTPELRLTTNANQTAAGSRDESRTVTQEGQYSFVDTGPWALVTVPSLRTEWQWRADDLDVDIAEDVAVDGDGSTGGEIAYLGDVDTHTRTAHGQTFTLAVPEAASMAESPGDVLDALTAASDRLRVGARDDEVWFGVAPTDADWGIRGVEYGGNDAWVLADSTLEDPGNVWFHEYVHTRQDYTTTTSGRWTMEAAAEYYAASMSLSEGLVGFDAFDRYVGYAERDSRSDAVLALPRSWSSGTNYIKGSLVWGAVDRQMRLATDSSASVDAVLYRLNRLDGSVSNDDFLAAVAAESTSAVARYADRYTTTRDTPAMWSRAEHEEAFDTQPPRMTYGQASYSVTGPFRDTTAGEPPVVYVGETLSVDASVTNDGGTTGEYVATLAVANSTTGDALLADTSGDLEPGDTADVALQHQFADPGTYDLTVGRTHVTVVVREPAAPVVEALSVAPTDPSPGESVTVTATLANPTDRPATGRVPVTLDGDEVGAFEVTLDPGDSTTRTLTVTAPESGDATIRAGDQSARIDVPGSDGSIPGFGVLPALVAVALAAAVVVGLRVALESGPEP